MNRLASDTSKIPPQQLDAEQSVLGSMMIEYSAVPVAMRILCAEDFYRPSHQSVFRAIVELYEREEPADLMTLQDELRQQDCLLDIGGVEYLMALVDSVPTAANIEHYSNIVKKYSLLRAQWLLTYEYKQRLDAPGADPKEVIAWLTDQITSLSATGHNGLAHISTMVAEYWQLLEKRKDILDAHGWSWGIPSLNQAFGKCYGAQMVTMKGKRGSGKTHLAVHSIMACSKANKAAVFFSMEMSWAQVMDRFVAYQSGLDSLELRRPPRDESTLWEQAAGGIAKLSDMPIYVDDKAELTVRQMHAKCKALQATNVELGLVVIDYAELIGSKALSSREQELSRIASGLRDMSKALGCTVLLLSQMNNDGGERWSQSIGNVSDLILVVKKDDNSLFIEKNRFGPEPTIPLGMDKKTSRVWELDTRFEGGSEESCTFENQPDMTEVEEAINNGWFNPMTSN
jgi:replicative DNA helicase